MSRKDYDEALAYIEDMAAQIDTLRTAHRIALDERNALEAQKLGWAKECARLAVEVGRLEAELLTYKQRKTRTRKPPKVDGLDEYTTQVGPYKVVKSAATTNGKKGSPADVIAKAIRSVAGDDKPLARHLRAVADARLRDEVPLRDIVREIHEGQEVRA